MLLYKDLITGDELISDAYKLKEVDDFFYEVDGEKIVINALGNVDIGANASALDPTEELEDGAINEINVVYSFRLKPTVFDKKSYGIYIKDYVKELRKRLQETNPERCKIFEANAQKCVKKILNEFSEFEFYTGESMSPDGMAVAMGYREDGITPYFIFFKDGLEEERL